MGSMRHFGLGFQHSEVSKHLNLRHRKQTLHVVRPYGVEGCVALVVRKGSLGWIKAALLLISRGTHLAV